MNLTNESRQTRIAIATGDVLTVLRQMPSNTCDGCLCDGPYGLTSIDKRCGRNSSRLAKGFMDQAWDNGVASIEVCQELRRVCKPGSWLLSFGHPRTWHRLAVNIEDAGWQIRDTLLWLYGQGFPKSQDLGKKMNDDAWSGYGFAQACL